MPNREDIDAWFGHPGFVGNEHPLAPEPDPPEPRGIPARRPSVNARMMRPARLPAADGVPHCSRCLYYHQPEEPCHAR